MSHGGARLGVVNLITTFVQLLGNEGALANVRTVLEERAREDWLVQGLASRLAPDQPMTADDPVPAPVHAFG